jgi:hypothetical protein
MAKGHQGNSTTAQHGTHANSTMAQCREVAQLTHLVDLANNQTRLDKVAHSNATKEAALKAKAATAATKLATLQSNATLMATCNQVFAAEQMRASCARMAALERLARLVANATALDAATKNNATKAAALKAKAAAEAGTLSSLQGNATLTQFCSVEETKATCHAMARLQKTVAEAANATWLDDHFKGNQTAIAKFKDRAAKEQTKLAALQSNSTLTSACSALNGMFPFSLCLANRKRKRKKESDVLTPSPSAQ